MSKIDDLIQKLCPNGVEYRTLGTLCSIETGNLNANCSVEGGEYAFFTTAKEISRINAYRWDTEALLVAGNANVGDVKHYIGKFDAYQRTYVLTQFDELMSVRFLYFVLSSTLKQYLEAKSNKAAMTYIVLDTLKGFRIPVPPLAVQEEIVRILDSFTSLEAELEAELEARRRQYEHYLHAAVLPDGDLEWTTLGDATTNHDRRRKPVTRSDRKEGEFPYYGANGIQDYVHDFIFDGTFLLVGEDGSVKNADGTPVLNWASGKIWVNNHAHVLTASSEQFSLRYLYYYLATVDVTAYVTGGTQPKINQKNLNSIPVPVIARDFQDRVVEILDRFDALVNDLSVGLPAELAARRKQYEFYRDRLLTFKEAA